MPRVVAGNVAATAAGTYSLLMLFRPSPFTPNLTNAAPAAVSSISGNIADATTTTYLLLLRLLLCLVLYYAMHLQ